MIFVTLGSQKFQFNRLLEELDRLIAQNVIQEPVFAQIGSSDYLPRHYEYKRFLDREEFAAQQSRADIIITHGGTGAIIGGVKMGKKVIAVPRSARFGEHVDDHQMQIIAQFGAMNIMEPCCEVAQLGAAYLAAKEKTYAPYHSNTHNILARIEAYLQAVESPRSEVRP